jgi:osmotically-inducible protein OsmY
MLGTLFWIAVGAAGKYFLDPDKGNRRRNMARDRLMSTARDVQREAEQRGRYAASTAQGMADKAQHELGAAASNVGAAVDDFTLRQRVESEVFSDPTIDRGKVAVSAENGVVTLRGEVSQQSEINSIEQRVRRVVGVQSVNNDLHAAGTSAPGGTGYSYAD